MMSTTTENETLELLQSDPNFLKYLAEHGSMFLKGSHKEYEMEKDRKYLEMHNRSIWQGKDGDFYTKVKGSDGKYRLHHATTREALEKRIIAHYKQMAERPTIRDVFEEWIKERITYGEVELGTIDKTRSEFERFIGGTSLENKDIQYVNEDILIPFIKSTIHDHQLTSKAWSSLKGILIGLFGFAKEKKYTSFSISSFFGDFHLPKTIFRKVIVKDEEQIFTDDEIRKIADWITSSPANLSSLSNLGILLDFYTGLRAGELATLKFTDFVGNELHVRRTETRHKSEDHDGYDYIVREHTKGKAGYRRIAIPDEALEIVKRIRLLNPNGEYLFMYGDHRLIGDAFSKKLFRICKYVGIPKRSLHKIRKTYATILWDAGLLTEKAIIKQMGHVDAQVTREHYYYHRGSEDNVDKINSIFKPMVNQVTQVTPNKTRSKPKNRDFETR